jgi:5'(3')-deoxyribonucleotidase
MTKKPILLTDLDDTLFPFAQTWSDWQDKTTGQPIDEALYWYYDIDAYLYNFLELQEKFISELHLLEPKPVPEAHETLITLSEHYNIVALTARNHDEWGTHTEEWVKAHTPYIQDIHYTRMQKGQPSVPKFKMAKKLKATALIDDTKHWIETLPSSIKGYVVKRPMPFASDSGAVTWDFILEDLLKQEKIQKKTNS